MNFRQFLEVLARLPARVWLQAVLGIIGFVILAVLGFAVIAGVAVVVLAIILAFKAKAWIASLFGRRGPPAEQHPRDVRRVTDVSYEIIEKKENRP
jgi:uncharacterized membrane protein YdfJ with MMPL/SSD domain